VDKSKVLQLKSKLLILCPCEFILVRSDNT